MKKNGQKRGHIKIPGEMTFSIFLFIVVSLIIPITTSAQTDTVSVPDFIETGEEGTLNDAVQTAINAGTLSSTVFKLKRNGYYVLTDSIRVPAGEHLTIVAPEPGNMQETAPPQIRWTANGDFSWSYFFFCYGDLTLKNVWLLCADTQGRRLATCIIFRDSPPEKLQQKCYFDGVIMDYIPIPSLSGGSVTVACKNFKGTFKNSYWKNNTDPHFRYYGRAVSFPYDSQGWHIDSLLFENCTFANIGYVYSQEGNWVDEGQYADYVKFNHCTFLNVVMFSLESGWWYKLSVTNSLWVNAFMYGYIPLYEDPGSGTFTIQAVEDFGFQVPFSDQDRRILFTNSSYFLEPWLVDWQTTSSPWAIFLHNNGRNDEIPQPQPMLSPATLVFFDSISTETGLKVYPYMNRANLHDSTDPGFILSPTDIDSIKQFILKKWSCCEDKPWAWKPENSLNRLWPLEENLAYTNDTLLTAGMGGFPLGDLYHWFPEEYQQWKAQKNDEKARINQWLETGNDPGVVGINEPEINRTVHFKLYQNYPNPFNPTTQINYSISRRSYITLKVYDLLGQEVLTLFEGVRQPGNYNVTFDGKGLSSGVYFYRMKAENFVAMKKLILLK